jgi:hypothetical protein
VGGKGGHKVVEEAYDELALINVPKLELKTIFCLACK